MVLFSVSTALILYGKNVLKQELAELDDEEKKMFLEDLGVKESGLDKLIKASFPNILIDF